MRRPSRNPVSDQVSSSGWVGVSGEAPVKSTTPVNSSLMKTHDNMEAVSDMGMTEKLGDQ